MADGPNYEALFTGMKCLHGGNAEDVKIIVRYLRFYQGQDGFERYLSHYLPMLPKDVAAEFAPSEEKTGTEVTEVPADEGETVTKPAKKRGRPSLK